MASGAATHSVSDANFDQEVLKSSEPVVVDFFAEWCGPCKAMAPALEAVAVDMKGKVKIAKLDVDQNPAVDAGVQDPGHADDDDLQGRQEVAERVGALTQKKQLQDWINARSERATTCHPGLVPGIHLSARSNIRGCLDPGDKHRDDALCLARAPASAAARAAISSVRS